MASVPTVPANPTAQMSVDEFAGKIKAKYPDYAGIDNATLAQKIVAKHPEYAGQVSFKPVAQTAGSPAIDAVAQAGHAAQIAPPAPTLEQDMAQAFPHGPLTSPLAPLQMAMHPLDALKGVGVLAKHLGAAGEAQATDIEHQGRTGELSPTATGVMSFPGHALGTVGRIAEGMATPQGVGMAAASAVPVLRIPAGIAGAVQSGLSLPGPVAKIVSGRAGPQDYENALLGASGLAGSAAVGTAGVKGALARPPLNAGQAVNNLRNAVNPVPQDAPGFVKSLTDQIDTVASHKSGVAVNDLPSLAKHLEFTAKADPYRAQFIEPFKNELTSRATSVNPETIGSLDARLSEINKTLQPRYARGADGSVQQVAAVGAENPAQLQAEAAGIRTQLAQELSKRTGVPADQIAAARKNYGQLNDLRDTVQWYADQATQRANTAAQAPPDTHMTVPGVVNKVASKAVRAVQDAGPNPRTPGKLIQRTFEGYSGQAKTPPPLAPAPAAPARPIPAWQQAQPTPAFPAPVQGAVGNGVTPAVPAGQPGLLRPSSGSAPSASPLPFGPTAASAGPGEIAGRGMTVGDEHPQISMFPEALRELLGQPKQLPPASSTQLPPSSLKPPSEFKLGPGAEGLMGTTHSISRNGQALGHITYDISGDTATVHHFGGPEQNYNQFSNALGREGLRAIADQIQTAHPEIQRINGIRMGGARGAEGRSVSVPLKPRGGS